MPLYVIPSLLSSCLLVGLGIFVFTRNCRHIVNISFATGLFSAALVQFSHFLLLQTKGFIWSKSAIVGICLLPPSFAIFSLTFSRRHYLEGLRQWRYVIAVMTGLSLWFCYLGISGSLLMKTTQFSFQHFEVYTIQPVGHYFLYFLFISLLFTLHNLENTYRNASSATRWGIKFLVTGLFATSCFYIFLISFMLLYNVIRVEYFVAEAVIIIISGILISFSLVRHRLMDTDVFISRQVVYNSFVLFVVGAYLITIALIGYLIKYHFIDQEITQFLVAEIFMYVAIIGLLLILLSEEVRHKVEIYISKHFYKHKYEYDEVWIAFTRRIGSNLQLKNLLPQIVSSLEEIINTAEVYIFLHDEKSNQLLLSESSVSQSAPVAVSMESKFVQYFQDAQTPHADINVLKNTTQLQPIYQEQQQLFETLGVALCAPLRVKDMFVGILAVGVERTGEAYTYEDYDLLHTIGIQAASMILNARLTENLSQARALETFHKFSAFIIHDLKNAVQNLSFVVQNAPDYFDDPEFREDAISTIAKTANRMNTMITKLSSVPERLEVSPVPTQISRFIDETLKQSKVTKLDHISIHVEAIDPNLSIPLDYHHFQSVIINLLSNAAEAIEGEEGRIMIRASQIDEHSAEISVADNGSGMSEAHLASLFTPFKSTKKKGLGIGLYQCKTIVEAHGGHIHVESHSGQGTEFCLRLPCNSSGAAPL
ncbi:PEP-CTERM system histidine kinase PrsK [candidate division KSB3 bacterium]|uniref:histidine kinase n=1 Tax=candidate division KSB3 bacterium TaxID=2044937 RepID=A0A2G6KAY3_9BACT|nr:MAG: PEP-CTERM system histidine kinase PrsK [candidate division KSB3 bacterium]